MQLSFLIVSLFLMVLSDCEGPPPTFDILWRAEENKGVRLPTEAVNSDRGLFWSTDGKELYYSALQGNGGTIKAYSFATSTSRTIFTTPNGIYSPFLSKDGSTFYFISTIVTSDNGFEETINKVSITNPTITKIDQYTGYSALYYGLMPYAVSGDNSLLAYSIRDSIYLYSNSTAKKQFLAEGLPISFSPDGKQLWYYKYTDNYDSTTFPTFVVTISDTTKKQLPFSLSKHIGSARWDLTGMKIVFYEQGCISKVKNITTGAENIIWQSPKCDPFIQQDAQWEDDFKDLQNSCWRDDNGLFILVTVKQIPCNCTPIGFTRQYYLRRITTSPRSDSVFAFLNDDVGSASLSPNAKKLAYTVGGLDYGIYIKELP